MGRFLIVAIILIGGGILGLLYGRFSYTQDAEKAKLGPIEITVKEKRTVNIPQWAGVASIVAGSSVLAFGFLKGNQG